ncbi:uncharacterized protein LOC142537496 [Primulina tabacum]|uniref:uncharacterized protein LOC142537496 n=1 Tax=Primulina tabacum TaxID=48773 RepID=UPI003F591290
MNTYINQQVNEGTRRGSIPGHVVIRRDREIADRNLFNDYFFENPRFHEVVEVFANQHLRSPNANNVARILYIGKQRGFPGMLESLDCMHWKWKNCPTAWARQYTGRSGSPTIILEAVADYDLWIWHAYFGMPCSNNDINVLEASTSFSDLAQGIAPPAHYTICGKEYA